MNKTDLVNAVSESINVSTVDVNNVLKSFIEVVEETVSKGEEVKLVGFGTFKARKRNARKGRNPQDGTTIEIPEKTVPVFQVGKKFKSLM